MPPTNAYTAQINASSSANDPNTSTKPCSPVESLTRYGHKRQSRRGTARRARLHYIELFAAASLAVLAVPVAFAGGSAVGAASYFDAHFA